MSTICVNASTVAASTANEAWEALADAPGSLSSAYFQGLVLIGY